MKGREGRKEGGRQEGRREGKEGISVMPVNYEQ